MNNDDVTKAMMMFARQSAKKHKSSLIVFIRFEENRLFIADKDGIRELFDLSEEEEKMNSLSLKFVPPCMVMTTFSFSNKSKLSAQYKIVNNKNVYVMVLDKNGDFVITS